MNDDAGRPDDLAGGQARSTGEQARATGASWFGGRQDAGPGTDAGQSTQARTLEQRYADAIAAMNRVISTLQFDDLPWITEVFRATAGVLDERDPSRAGVLNNLGSASQLAYVDSKQVGDLEDAVGYYRDASNSARQDDPDLVLYLCNLALALTDLAILSGQARHAEEGVRAARTAVEQTPRRDPRRVMA